MDARCDAGISYRDFAPAVGEAKYEVNLYLESKESDVNKPLADSIRKTMAHYMEINYIWNINKKGGCTWHYQILNSFFSMYPDVDKQSLSCEYSETYTLNQDKAISFILTEASKELKHAITVISE